MAPGDLISTDRGTNFIYQHSGLSNVLLGSFASVGDEPTGIVVDENRNLISTDLGLGFIYQHDGISATLTGSFAAPATAMGGLALDANENLISTSDNPDFIYQHSGISDVLTGSFATPQSSPTGMVVINGNLISTDQTDDFIFQHDGISATLTGSFAAPDPTPMELTSDVNDNLISAGESADDIYRHSGISAVLLGSFESAGAGLFGVATEPESAIFTRSASDTFNLSDTFTRGVWRHSENISDTTNLSDTFTRGVYSTDRSFTETMSLSDSLEAVDHATPVDFVIAELRIAGSLVSETLSSSIKVAKRISEHNSSSTFSATINNRHGVNAGSFVLGDEVEIRADQFDPPQTIIFTGILENVDYPNSRANKEKIKLSGRDYSARLMDRNILPTVYTNLLTGSIVKDIINQYTDDISTNNVDDSTVTVERIAFNHKPVFDGIKRMADIAQYFFFVDLGSDLNFKERESVDSNLTFDSGNVYLADVKERRDTIFNEVWVYGDRYRDATHEEFTADGGSIFTLDARPHDTEVHVGSPVSVSTVQKGEIFKLNQEPISGTNYLIDFFDQRIIFISGTNNGDSVPVSGTDLVTVFYSRDLPIVKMGRDSTSINQFGLRIKKIVDRDIQDPDTAQQFVDAFLAQNSLPKKDARLNLKGVVNVTPGELATVNLPDQDISDQKFEIISADYEFNVINNFSNKVLSVRLNKKITDVTDTIKDLVNDIRDLQDIDDPAILTRSEFTLGSTGLRQSGCIVSTSSYTGSTLILSDSLITFEETLASGTNENVLAGEPAGSTYGPFVVQFSGCFF